MLTGNTPKTRYAIQISVDMTVDTSLIDVNGKTFTPSFERIVAHELGHAYQFSKGGFGQKLSKV